MFDNQKCLWQELQKSIKEFGEVQVDGLIRRSVVYLASEGTSACTSKTNQGVHEWIVDQ